MLRPSAHFDFKVSHFMLKAPPWRRSGSSIDSAVWCFISFCFLAAGAYGFALKNFSCALPNAFVGLACLLPPVAVGIFKKSVRLIWWGGVFIFALAETALIYQTGGSLSPIFGPQILFIYFVIAAAFYSLPLRYIFTFTALHFAAWVAVTHFLGLKVPADLTQTQILLQDAIALVSILCIKTRAAQLYAEEYERQTRELTDAQNHLCHVEKMAELGKLVATTAHEISQPVQVLVNASSILKVASKNPCPTQLGELSERMTDASVRLQRLLGHLRNFSRKDPFTLKDIDVSEAVRAVFALGQYDLRWSGVECQLQIESEPLWIRGDSMKVQQILLNLINNARDACSKSQNPMVKITASISRDWIRVMVWNNGDEIPKHEQARLFEPYFTTKEPGQGTGLGLTICLQLVRQHQGRIFFSSAEKDTTFVVDFPRVQRKPQVELVPEPEVVAV